VAGYSGTPLVKKLGIKPGARLHIADAPNGYAATLGALPEGVVRVRTLRGPLDVVQYFTVSRAALERRFAVLAKSLAPAGMLWISWPKKSAQVDTDVTGDVVRGVGLKNGLVDVKVCAVDETWSGLKFVRRLADR